MTIRRGGGRPLVDLRVVGAAVAHNGLTVVRLHLESRRRDLFLHAEDVDAELPGGGRLDSLALVGRPARGGGWQYDCVIRFDAAARDPYAIRLRVRAVRVGSGAPSGALDIDELRGPWTFVVPIRAAAHRPDPAIQPHRRPPRLLRQTIPYVRVPDPDSNPSADPEP